jgi:hypothetical protein
MRTFRLLLCAALAFALAAAAAAQSSTATIRGKVTHEGGSALVRSAITFDVRVHCVQAGSCPKAQALDVRNALEYFAAGDEVVVGRVGKGSERRGVHCAERGHVCGHSRCIAFCARAAVFARLRLERCAQAARRIGDHRDHLIAPRILLVRDIRSDDQDDARGDPCESPCVLGHERLMFMTDERR